MRIAVIGSAEPLDERVAVEVTIRCDTTEHNDCVSELNLCKQSCFLERRTEDAKLDGVEAALTYIRHAQAIRLDLAQARCVDDVVTTLTLALECLAWVGKYGLTLGGAVATCLLVILGMATCELADEVSIVLSLLGCLTTLDDSLE